MLGLQKAKEHLRRNFGHQSHSAQKMLSELLGGKPLKGGDPKALRNFIIQLEGVHIRAIETGRENAFNSQDIIANVLKKVDFLKNRWAESNLKRKEKWDSPDGSGPPDATFSDLLTFLNRQNQLALEKQAYEVPKQEDSNDNSKKSSAIASASTSTPQNNKNYNKPNNQRNNYRNSRNNNGNSNDNYDNSDGQANNHQSNSRPRSRQQSSSSEPGSASSSRTASPAQDPAPAAETSPKMVESTQPMSAGWRCWVCKGTIYHRVDQCAVFTSMSVDERCDLVRKLELCNICLTKGHMARDCNRTWKCRECQGKHHTTIHWDDQADQASS